MVGAHGDPEVGVKMVAHSSNHSKLVMLLDNRDASALRGKGIAREAAWLVQCSDSSNCWQSAAWSDRDDKAVSWSMIDCPDCSVQVKGHRACVSASWVPGADTMHPTHMAARSV